MSDGYLFRKAINTRGRKREARRWIQQTNRLSYFVTFGDGPPRAGTDQHGRTFTQRCEEGGVAWDRASLELKARDPVLYAAVMEIMWAEWHRKAALTFEQLEAERRRRQDKYCREHCRVWRPAASRSKLHADK